MNLPIPFHIIVLNFHLAVQSINFELQYAYLSFTQTIYFLFAYNTISACNKVSYLNYTLVVTVLAFFIVAFTPYYKLQYIFKLPP